MKRGAFSRDEKRTWRGPGVRGGRVRADGKGKDAPSRSTSSSETCSPGGARNRARQRGPAPAPWRDSLVSAFTWRRSPRPGSRTDRFVRSGSGVVEIFREQTLALGLPHSVALRKLGRVWAPGLRSSEPGGGRVARWAPTRDRSGRPRGGSESLAALQRGRVGGLGALEDAGSRDSGGLLGTCVRKDPSCPFLGVTEGTTA